MKWSSTSIVRMNARVLELLWRVWRSCLKAGTKSWR